MNCPKCGENLSEKLSNCPKCGESLTEPVPVADPEAEAIERSLDAETGASDDTSVDAAGGVDHELKEAVEAGSVAETVGSLAAAQLAAEANDEIPDGEEADKREAEKAKDENKSFAEWEKDHKEYFEYIDNLRKKPVKKAGFKKLIAAIKNFPVYKKAILGACALLLVVAIGVGGWYLAGTMQLKKALQNDWALVEDTNDFFVRVLSFEEDGVDFNFESRMAWLNNTIASYEYKVVSPSKVKFTTAEISKTVSVELNGDGKVMIITPSLTDNTELQTWKVIDKDRSKYWK